MLFRISSFYCWGGVLLMLAVIPSRVQARVTSEVTGGAQFYMDQNSAVSGVEDQEQSLYQSQLAGKFSVRFSGLAPGAYRVVVGNAEMVGDGEEVKAFRNYRIFTIRANGKVVAENLNLIEKFGPAKKGDVTFSLEAEAGSIQIDFVPKPEHGLARMSFVRVYDASGGLVGEETALSRKPKNWTTPVRAFVPMPDVFQNFPKKDPVGAYPEMKIYNADGKPWRAAKEDWEGARRRVASDPEWSAWLVQQREATDKWMARHQDRVPWIGGWYHDFVSSKDGSFIEWTEQIPGEEVPTLHSASDPNIEVTPKIFGGWVFQFRVRHAAMIRAAAQLYRLTNEPKYAEWAASQLDFYANHFAEWPVSRRGDGARLYWQTLDEATALVKYTETARLLEDYVTPERKLNWKQKFFYPEAVILNARLPHMSNISGIHNIATWHRCAVAQVALLYRDDALWKEVIDGEFGLRRQLSSGVSGDYIWWEQSFGYNNYLVEATLLLFQTAGIQGRAAELANEMSIVENLMLSLVYLRFPDSTLPNPADSTARNFAPNNYLFASAYRIFPTTLGLAKAAERKNWDTLLDPPASQTVAPKLPEVKSRNLDSIRMALLKSGPWQVFVHYGQLTSSHAQAELLNYSAFYNDIDITHDPGTVGYGSPMHAGYYTRGLNHNVPLVDGEGAYLLPQKGEVKEYAENPPRISVTHPTYRTGVAASRSLRIDGDKLTDVVTINVKDGTERALGFALHLQGKVQLPAEFKDDASFGVSRPDSFSYWTGVKKASYRDKAEFDVRYGNTTLHLTISVPGPFIIWHGSTPDFPSKRREGFYVEKMGSEAIFETVFAPVTGRS